MTSLRAKILLPLLVLTVAFLFTSSSLLLSALRQNLAGLIRSDLTLLWNTLRDRDDIAHSGVLLNSGGNRVIMFLAFDSTGHRLAPSDPATAPFAELVASPSDVKDPSEFVNSEIVGIPVERPHRLGARSEVATLMMLVRSRPYLVVYNNAVMHMVVAAGLFLLGVMIVGSALSMWLIHRIAGVTQRVRTFDETTPQQQSSRRFATDELGLLDEAIEEASNRVRKSSAEIARLQVVRSQFLGNVSHEVRTPLFSLKGFLETLLDGGMSDPKVSTSFLEKALHHAERIDALLRDLIDISRIESGEMRMSFRYFGVTSLLDAVRRDHEDIAAKKGQTLDVGLPSADVEVLGDKDRLRQALANLIDNALKYSPEGSRVTVRADVHPDSVVLSVSDSGPGIPQSHLDRIFERFYRVDADRSRAVGGTGLGLAIVKHIVEAHDSSMTVTSAEGSGTTFSFELRR